MSFDSSEPVVSYEHLQRNHDRADFGESRFVHTLRAQILQAVDALYASCGRLSTHHPELPVPYSTQVEVKGGGHVTSIGSSGSGVYVPGRRASGAEASIRTAPANLNDSSILPNAMNAILGPSKALELGLLDGSSNALFIVTPDISEDIHEEGGIALSVNLSRVEKASEEEAAYLRPTPGPLPTAGDHLVRWSFAQMNLNDPGYDESFGRRGTRPYPRWAHPIVRGRRQRGYTLIKGQPAVPGTPGNEVDDHTEEEYFAQPQHLLRVPNLNAPSLKQLVEQLEGRPISGYHVPYISPVAHAAIMEEWRQGIIG